ncbi:MAG: hypothetical protein NTZ68_02410 [Candidatus Dependentiae bacterium]|nr:hypothetical protein [Candidatus Dependentiae bacterium]
MNKKSLFLVFLLTASQSQALWELPAAFLVGMAVKTPMGKKISSFIFSRCKKVWLGKTPEVKIANSMTSNSTIQSDLRSGFAFLGSAAKAVASKSQVAMNSSIVAFRARAQNIQLKNPLTSSVEKTRQEHIQTNWNPYGQPYAHQSTENVGPATYNFTKVDAKTLSQSTSGFFPRITNNYYSGVPEHVTVESGKKQFWRGVGVGGFTMGTTMAWLHSKQEQKK